jgi:hypothetical protein
MIYFLTPYSKFPNGGIKVICEMVSTLVNCGYDVLAMHLDVDLDTQIEWISNPYPFISFNLNSIKDNDIIVIPEIFPNFITNILPHNIRKIIFNQNTTYMLDTLSKYNYNIENLGEIYNKDKYNTTDMIFVSSQNNNYISPYLPNNIKSHVLTQYINNNIFNYSQNKKIQIACMPRKGREIISQVLTKIAKEIPYIFIYDKTQHEVAEIMKESLIFLSWSNVELEGFLLPAAEAMACGCMVVGNTPGGSQDFMLPDHCYPILTESHKNNIHFLIKYIVDQYNKNPEIVVARGEQASKYILDKYSYHNYKDSVINIWKSILEN